MHPAAEVDLGHRRQPGQLEDVDEHRDLDAVPRHERHALEQGAATGVLTGEGLDEAGQVRPVQVEQRARHQLGHPAAARREDGLTGLQRAVVERLDEARRRAGQQRADHPCHELGVELFGVRVEKTTRSPVET